MGLNWAKDIKKQEEEKNKFKQLYDIIEENRKTREEDRKEIAELRNDLRNYYNIVRTGNRTEKVNQEELEKKNTAVVKKEREKNAMLPDCVTK